ncbi:MAG: hypothetical protein A2512_01070 [Deltaproteobacteria bacterium RIFOXYD12_FULL_56_24]|nr:MAG: hypothetical protein A2512_01070 [Deltaproteobacteria bacterium RIFOXYD12_FULL_56_24]
MPQSLAALTLFFLLGLPFFVGTGLLAVPDIPPFSFYSALHSAVEIFTVAVAILVFAMGFHLLEKKRPTALFVLASAFLGVALLDFLHLISHSGLPDFFTTNTPHKATILWLAARLLAAGALLAWALLQVIQPVKAVSRYLLLSASLAYTFFCGYVGVFYPEWVPATFVPGQGLTPFKIGMEWLVILLHAATLVVLAGCRHRYSRGWLSFLAPALLLLIASELFFTLYVQVNDTINLLGHVYRLFAYLLIYRAIFIEGVRQPYIRREEALRLIEYGRQEWRQTFDAISDPIFMHDTDFRITLCNQAYAGAVGLPLHRIIGRPYYEVLPRSDGPHLECREALALGEEREADLLPADEGVIYNIRFIPVRYEATGNFHFLLIMRDITERKRAEEALRFQLSFQKLVADLSADFVTTSRERTDLAVNHALALCADFFQADRSYVFLFADYRHTMSNTYEYCAEGIASHIEAIQEVPLAAFPWFSRKILMQDVVHVPTLAILPPEAVAEKTEFARQDIQSLICLPLVGDGHLLGFFGLDAVRKSTTWSNDQIALLAVVADIIAVALARAKTELQLEQNTARLENAQRIAHIGNWDWDILNRTLVWSDEIYRIFGVAPQEFAASYEAFLGYVLPSDRPMVEQAVQEALDENQPYDIEHRVQRPDGGLRWVREHAEIIRDETGRPLRMSGTVQDITERKSLEEQILQARKMEAVGVLAGGIAHDFNNILTPIMMHTQMVLMDTPAGTSAHHSLEQVQKAAERARDLVRQILDFSRKGKYEPQPMKIGPVIKEGLKFLRSTIPMHIELASKIFTGRDLVRADPTQILQVVMNLTINAAQAMHEKGGRIEITLSEQDEEGWLPPPGLPLGEKYLKMVVSDTGVGIPSEILPRIFEPYFTTKGKGEGTGMGLAVVHGMVEKHGGAITVKSEPGKGTDFEIFLPLVAGEAATISDFNQPLPGGRERILLVDDDQAVLAAVAPALARLGYRLTTKTDSLEALAAFRADPSCFDLVITDQTMPGINGSAMASEMLRLRPELPVILCTGFSGKINEEMVRTLGIAALVAKPFGMEDIVQVIRKVLGKERVRDPESMKWPESW